MFSKKKQQPPSPARLGALSGEWVGFYLQGDERYPQDMILEFADSIIRGEGSDEVGDFVIEGEFRVGIDGFHATCGWIKTYEGAHSVLYYGEFDGSSLTGEWRIGGWGEGFTIEPSSAARRT